MKVNQWLSVMLLTVAAAFYVLSYPIALKNCDPPQHHLSLYTPVEWLVDNTPAREPMCWWASRCGARLAWEIAMYNREHERKFGTGPEPPP